MAIRNADELRDWLTNATGPSGEWAAVIAARASLRALPFVLGGRRRAKWFNAVAFGAIRASAISWAARNYPGNNMVAAANAATHAANAAADTADADAYAAVVYVAHASDAAPDAAYAAVVYAAVANTAANAAADAAANAAANAADAATYVATDVAIYVATDAATVAASYAASYAARIAFWSAIEGDCRWLESNPRSAIAAQALTSQKLWLTDAPKDWFLHWATARERLLSLDDQQSYQVWIDWFERRIMGQASAFAIPGDTDRIEDKAILARLADAQNEDFWDKGSAYVNLTLQSWIEEVRARVGPGIMPAQDLGAVSYAINASGKLDRLPASDQRGLHNSPDQREVYQDVRKAALALQAEGQRLGATLKPAVDQFLASFPDDFDAARCYSVWRDAVGLRTILLEHKAVAEGTEPDEKRLDPAVAERLGGFLNQYNVFAIGDVGLRAKDEAAISPQERVKAEDEAEKAAPLVEALLNWPDIMTDAVHDDLIAEVSLEEHYPLEPYGGQLIDQANRTKRNIFAGLIAGVGRLVSKAKAELGKTAGSMREGAERQAGAGAFLFIFSEIAGVTKAHVSILKFLKDNLAALKSYAETAYASTSLQWLWDALATLVGRL